MVEILNNFEIRMKSTEQNESFARHIVGEFVLELNPTLDQLEDIKTAVSEAVTNCIIHGYNGNNNCYIDLKCTLFKDRVEIIISDNGVGIENIDMAMQPFYTSKPSEERSGMGFTLMKSFMSNISVTSTLGNGVTLKMTKILSQEEDNARAQ